MNYFSSSEFVSSGHPDRCADNIAAVLINAIQHRDGANSHAAVEVFLTHDTVYFGGEVTTTLTINESLLRTAVSLGMKRSGYVPQLRKYFKKDEVILAEDLKIVNNISAQSPDIALGTTDRGADSGWNDQGVYFSSCDNTNAYGLGTPHYIAQTICKDLQAYSMESVKNDLEVILGPDNKCVVTVQTEKDGFTPIAVTAITIAVAHASKNCIDDVRRFVKHRISTLVRGMGYTIARDCKWVINGTGRFVIHGCISDTSMTGRKISVNHPSAGPIWCNKMIGGGSLVKPAHASDLMLNLMSRYIAEVVVAANLSSYAVVGCSGAIGVHGLQSIFIKGDDAFEKDVNKEVLYKFFEDFIEWSPIAIANKFHFFDYSFDFGSAVNDNFFGEAKTQPWEDKWVIMEDARALREYMINKDF